MEPAVVAALVSGVVSILGVLTSFYLGRRARETELQKLQVQAQIKEAEAAAQSLKAYASVIERARIACWRLRGETLAVSRGSVAREESESLARSFESSRNAFAELETAWADAKVQVPSEIVGYIRFLRHDARYDVGNILSHLHSFLGRWEPGRRSEELRREALSIGESTVALLAKLDELFGAVSTAIKIAAGDVKIATQQPWAFVDERPRPKLHAGADDSQST